MSKTILITGASCGIGRATAEIFAENNYRVIVNYLSSESSALRLVSELKSRGCDCMAVCADVSKSEQVKNMMEQIKNFSTKIDVLVNNAGIAMQKLFCDTDEKEWDKVFDVNIKGMFNCCKAVVPAMIKSHSGKIVNVSSICGMSGLSCEVAYSSSKAAVIGFTKALAKELGPCNINVNCVAPGVIDTKMNRDMFLLSEEALKVLENETPLGVLGTPRDVAETILFLAKDESKFITGQVISPNGGIL